MRWIAPVLPGGAGDLIARAIAPRLTEIWYQQVIIDNRSGGGGTLGMGIAAKMPADGHTLVLGVSSFVVMAPGVYTKLAYDPVKDFSPVTQILAAPMILVTHPSLPAKNVKELTHYARTRKTRRGELRHARQRLGQPPRYGDVRHDGGRETAARALPRRPMGQVAILFV